MMVLGDAKKVIEVANQAGARLISVTQRITEIDGMNQSVFGAGGHGDTLSCCRWMMALWPISSARHMTHTAEQLGVSRNTLYRKLRKHGIAR